MALKYISSTISETDGHVFYDNHDLDRVIWVDPQEGSHVVWERQQPSEWKGLRILPTGDNMVSVRLTITGTPSTPINPIYYSGDQGVTWNELTTTDSAEYSEIWLKANNPTGYHAGATTQSVINYYSIHCTGESYCTGNITSLLDETGDLVDLSGTDVGCLAGIFRDGGNQNDLIGYDCFYPTTLYHRCYFNCLPVSTVYVSSLPASVLAISSYGYMFSGCTELEYAPYLNATTLEENCYYGMFQSCHSLKESPILPATNLAINCYTGMFEDCTSLISTPELPATTLYNSCYSYMFQGCTSLTIVTGLPATNLAPNCYRYMFRSCRSLVNVPTLPATTMQTFCYQYMFSGCTSIVVPPSLPAQVLAVSCYAYMFNGCTSIVDAPELPATSVMGDCYSYMFLGCTSLVNPPSLPATTLSNGCYYGMFQGCTSLQEAPILPATTLTEGCYTNMFYGCSSLNTIICLATNRYNTATTSNWCYGVPQVGDFYCPSEVTPQWVEWNEHNIPPYWTRHSTDKVIIYGYSEHGTVTGSGTYNIGVDVTLTFTPAQGYVFDHWEYIDETTASTDNPYTFVASENLVLKAVTEYARYTIDAGALNGVVAATVGGSPVQLPYTGAYGTEVELTVSPTQGHEFWFWVDGSTDNPRRVTLTEDMELYAVCVATDMQYLYFLPGEYGDVGNKSPYNIRFIWSDTLETVPNIEYSTYETDTQSWSEWTECTNWRLYSENPNTYAAFAPMPEGQSTTKVTRLRGYNSDGFNGKLNINTSPCYPYDRLSRAPLMTGYTTALLYGGVPVTTLTQPYCFANLIRMKYDGQSAFVNGFGQPRIEGTLAHLLSPTILSPHCYDGFFAIDFESAGSFGYAVPGSSIRLPATNLAEGCYRDINSFVGVPYNRYLYYSQVFYYGPSLTESQMTYYCGEWFKGSRSGWLHVRQGVTVPEIGHGIIILHDLA